MKDLLANEERNIIAQQLSEERRKRGLTQEEMWDVLRKYDVSEWQYKRAERGSRHVSPVCLAVILAALGIEPDEMFYGLEFRHLTSMARRFVVLKLQTENRALRIELDQMRDVIQKMENVKL